MSETISKANAFVFKVFINGEYRMCVCTRKNDVWSEKDIVYVDNPPMELYDELDEKFFHIIFVVYETDDTGFWIKPGSNPTFLKSDTAVAQDMYGNDKFFQTIEKGYQHFYGQPEIGQVDIPLVSGDL